MCIRTFLHSIMHSLIHSRHRMLNLMWKLLEIISCCNIVFTWEHGQYWSKIFHKNRKIARRENRRMAFESDSIRISSIFASSRKRFLNERGGGGWSHNGPDFGNFWRYLQPIPPLFHQRCFWCIYKGINGSHVAPRTLNPADGTSLWLHLRNVLKRSSFFFLLNSFTDIRE